MIPLQIIRITDPRLAAVRQGHTIYTSLEGENPGGSIKDRMVDGELQHLLKSGDISPGSALSEISAGSTATSLAWYCQKYGLGCSLFVPITLPPEVLSRLRTLGADVHALEVEGAYEKYDEFTRTFGIRRFDQMGKRHLTRHYEDMGRQLARMLGALHAIVGGVGTGHSLVGIGAGFGSGARLISAEPTVARAVPGIRNLTLESYGEKDPCDVSKLQRQEIDETGFFEDLTIETDHGRVQIPESFRVVLGTLAHVLAHQKPTSVFAVGASNRRIA